jgi:hypothetical protein
VFSFLVSHPVPVFVFLSLVAIIFVMAWYLGEPIISPMVICDDNDDDEDSCPWAGGPTGISIGIEDIGKV